MLLLTAWHFLIDLGHDTPDPFQDHPHAPVPLEGRTVLVNDAAGGVGHLLVQLARSQTARVIAVAAGENAALLRGVEADQVIDYKTHVAEDVVSHVDLVVDAVGGENMDRFMRVVKTAGALFLVNPVGFPRPTMRCASVGSPCR